MINQSAFPLLPPIDDTGRTAVGYPYPDPGMTLRDYFAAKAMMVVAKEIYSWGKQIVGDDIPTVSAKMAYEFADAMLAERNR